DDAARGFAYIDLCRKLYDVVLMNPPYGDPTMGTKEYIEACFPLSKYDLYSCFVDCFCEKLADGGALGALTSRTGFLLNRLREWRLKVAISGGRWLETFADLGYGVLDSAMVQTAAYVIRKSLQSGYSIFRDLRSLTQSEKEESLRRDL